MATDSSGISDEVLAELNPDIRQTTRPGAVMQQPDPIPDRPSDSASKAKWVDYVVALGADRTFVTEDTEHIHLDGLPVTEPALTREQLIDLADRLGG